MHPILNSGANLSTYLLGWLFIGSACAALIFTNGGEIIYSLVFGILSAFLASVLFFPVYYPCLVLKPEKTPLAILLSSLAVATAVFGAIWAGAMFLALHLLRQGGYESFQMPDFFTLILMGGVICVLTEAVYYIYIAHMRARESYRLEQELRVMAREAELRALRAQLNPHFLFNSLNSINALTGADPKRAREMCVLLSDFFRKGLHLEERLTVPLSEELDLLKNYLAIEQIRFGSRLEVDWDIDDTVLNARIPTLLLQPLVENAVKHGISQLVEGGTIRIKAEVNDGNVLVLLENPMDSDANPSKGLGLGIKQVHQRLTASFGGDGRMEVDSKNGLHSVRLFFPLMTIGASDA
jgi:hypothetical protein